MPDIDVGQLSEAINDKMDRDLNNRSTDSGLRRLIESYHNGTEWYKVFEEIQSDGTAKYWCEQGGRVYNNADVPNTINLLKPYQDTNYTVLINHGVSGAYYAGIYGAHTDEPYDFTATSFKAYTYPAAGINSIQWYAFGYIS